MRAQVVRSGWAALLLVVGALPLAGAYAGGRVVPLLLLGAVVLPGALVLLGRRLDLPTWVVAIAVSGICTAAALNVLGGVETALVARDGWRATLVGDLLGPFVDAVPRLLTAARPADVEPALLTPVLVLVWLTALAVFLVVTARERSAVVPLLGAATLYGAAALLTAGTADRWGVAAVLLVALAGLSWLSLDRPVLPTRDRRGVRIATLVPVAAVAAVGTVALVSAALPTQDAFEPRELVDPPVVGVEATNPLPQLSIWGEVGDQELFRVSGQVPERMSLVALSRFDGAQWQVGNTFRPLGAVGTPSLPDGRFQARYDVTVEIAELDGLWLPAAGRPISSSLPDPYVELDSGALVTATGATPGLRYGVAGAIDRAAPGSLRGAGTEPRTPSTEPYLEVPRLPAALTAYATDAVTGSSDRLEQALALEDLVRGERTVDPLAPVGSSYARLQTFLFADDGVAGAQSGTSEQFAAAYVVLARSVGLPSRLVVGFEIPSPGADGVAVVQGRHARAWPEVHLAGAGWVALDPVPDETSDGGGSRSELVGDEEPQGGDDEAEQDPPAATPTPPSEAADALTPPPAESGTGPWIAVLAGGLVLVLLALALLLLARARRRLRHRRAGWVGAWAEAMDGWWLAGRRPTPGQSAPDIAEQIDARVGGDRARALAGGAERASYAPVGTGPGRDAGGDDGADAVPWSEVASLRRDLRRGAGRPARLRWWWDPRVLRRRG